MSKASQDFTAACRTAGIYHVGCGLAIRDLLLELRRGPIPVADAASGGAKMSKYVRMGVAVKTGFARFDEAERVFAITPAGETWLQEVEIMSRKKPKRVRVNGNGLIPSVEKLCPGWKVIAGPLKVNSSVKLVRDEERGFARTVMKEQQRAGTATKLVMFRGEAFVLRSAEGWKDEKEALKRFRSDVKGEPLSVWEARRS